MTSFSARAALCRIQINPGRRSFAGLEALSKQGQLKRGRLVVFTQEAKHGFATVGKTLEGVTRTFVSCSYFFFCSQVDKLAKCPSLSFWNVLNEQRKFLFAPKVHPSWKNSCTTAAAAEQNLTASDKELYQIAQRKWAIWLRTEKKAAWLEVASEEIIKSDIYLSITAILSCGSGLCFRYPIFSAVELRALMEILLRVAAAADKAHHFHFRCHVDKDGVG